MTEPVDLTALRDLTDGDKELEKELFASFNEVSNDFLTVLETLIDSSDNKAWEITSHSFKGAAFNLGANALAEKCREAEEICVADEQGKKAILESIKEEYEKVKMFLEEIY